MEKKDEIIDLITKLEKKEIAVKNNPEVLKRFEEIWISFADESDFSIQAVGFLYDGFVFGTPSIFYKYVVSKADRTQLINKLLKSNPNIKDKIVRLKFLYEYLGLLFQKNEIDKYLLGLILSDISYQKDKKAFRYLLKYFIKQISLDYHYPSFDSFGFNLYTSSSILQYNLSLLDFIEKEDLRRVVDQICEYLTKYQIIAFNPKTHDGILRHIIARSSKLSNDIQVTLILYKKDQRTIKVAKELLKIKNIKSVYISINDNLEAIENFGNDTFLVAGTETITEQLGDFKFELLPHAFFQLNLEQTNKLYNEIINLAKLKGYENVIDGYCGVGTIGIFLSKYVKEVRGIDNNKEAIQNANENVKLNGINNAKFYSGNILSYINKWENEGFIPDVLVVDPPRTGLELRLLNYLQTNPVKKIIYVSCNPSTLAKNCNHLQKKYHILDIQPLDMFPNTSNVECVVCLERR